jgi:hypothetical protein
MFPHFIFDLILQQCETKGRPIRYEAYQCVNYEYLLLPVESRFDLQYFQSVFPT